MFQKTDQRGRVQIVTAQKAPRARYCAGFRYVLQRPREISGLALGEAFQWEQITELFGASTKLGVLFVSILVTYFGCPIYSIPFKQ